VFLGSEVRGFVDDANTIRIGLPYDSGTGEGQHRTQGELGTVTAPVMGGTIDAGVSTLHQQLRDQHATIDELRRRITQLERRLEQLMRTLPRGH
jgi:hypothetical protein